MKRVLAISAVALLSGSLMSAPALAQVSVDTGSGVSAGTGTNADTSSGSASGSATGTLGAGAKVNAGETGANVNVDTNTTASVGGSWDGLMSSLGDSSVSGSVGSMAEVGTIHVVKISSLDNADMDALAKAKTENQASIDKLHSSIEANAKLKAALEAQDVDSSDIVAANVAADGSLTVYVE